MKTRFQSNTLIISAILTCLCLILKRLDLLCNGVEFNRKYSELWPVIITQKDPLPEAEERDGETGKLEKYFSENQGEGG